MPEITWVHVLASLALVAGAAPLARLAFRVELNAAVFGDVLRKLVDQGNLERAVKLCRAAPASPLARGARGMLQAFEQGVNDSLALREAFERAAGGLGRTIFAWSPLSWAGLVLCALALGAAGLRGFQLGADEAVPALLAPVLCLAGLRKAYTIRARFEATREKLLDHLQETALRR